MMGKFPRTEREARARSNRKLKALRRRANELLYDTAGLWDEGQVSGSIDMLLEAIDYGIQNISEAMDEEVERRDFEREDEL